MKAQEYKKIIDDAIKNETEAAEFYTGVFEKVKEKGLKVIFKELADEERKHKASLKSFLSDSRSLSFDEKADYNVSETVKAPRLTVDMKPVDAIALAMKREEEAMNMYKELAKCSSDAGQKKVFKALSKMEQGHKARLEDIYTNMAFPEVW